jgi:hypothetical protein
MCLLFAPHTAIMQVANRPLVLRGELARALYSNSRMLEAQLPGD